MTDLFDNQPTRRSKPKMQPTPPCAICGGTDAVAPYGLFGKYRWLHVQCWEAERDAMRARKEAQIDD